MTLLEEIDELLAHRDAIDQKIAAKRAEAAQELARMQALVARMGGTPVNPAVKSAKPHDPWLETDAGMGIGGRSDLGNVSRQDFVDELAELRARGAAKRKSA